MIWTFVYDDDDNKIYSVLTILQVIIEVNTVHLENKVQTKIWLNSNKINISTSDLHLKLILSQSGCN
jgi:hypothetical protein